MQLHSFAALVAMALSMALGGCAGHGEIMERSAVTVFGEVTVVAPTQFVSDRFMSTAKIQLIWMTNGKPSQDQRGAVAAIEVLCRDVATDVHPNLLVAGVTDGAVNGTIGGFAQGGAASAAYSATANQLNNYPLLGFTYSGIWGVLSAPFNENATRNGTVRRCGSVAMGRLPKAGISVLVKDGR